MSIPVLNLCWPLKMPPTPKAVLISMADQADDEGRCWPSIKNVSDRTCISPRAVIDGINWLEKSGALIADRTNGRHTKYQLTPANFHPITEQSPRSQARKTHADAALVPMQMPHQCSSRTGADAAPTHADAALVPMQMPHQPMQMPHTNPQEPPLNQQGTQISCIELQIELAAPEAVPVVLIPLVGGKEFGVQAAKVAEWQMAFPGVDVQTALLRARQWCIDNPSRKKTAKGAPKFLNAWLAREQDNSRGKPQVSGIARPQGVPAWCQQAGFPNVWEAESAGCWPRTAHQFRDGRRIANTAEVTA